MKKFDIHMHTTYSDGVNSVQNLLKLATKTQLELIAITDHNNVDAHIEIANNDYSNLFAGKIVKGVEIYSYYKGKVVEFLVYDFDIDEMKSFLDNSYDAKWNRNRIDTVLEKLKKAAKKIGITFNNEFSINTVGECGKFFNHMKQFKENEKFFAPEIWSYEKSFFRKEVCNSDSPFYVDYAEFYISPKDLIEKSHQFNGKIFLAHPFEYKFSQEDFNEFLNDLKNWNIDGIECYYPKFEKHEIEQVLNFAKDNNLLVCGGSDYHGGTRINKLGVITEKVKIDYNNYTWLNNMENINKLRREDA